MSDALQGRLRSALERPHRLGMIGGALEEQLAHCASFSSVVGSVIEPESRARLVDLGTGGGLPGVAIAALLPSTHWVLVEMRTSRAQEVERAVMALGLTERVEVVAAPAQELGVDPAFRDRFDGVVARAFGPPDLVAECAAPLLKIGGSLVVSEPPKRDVARWPVKGLAGLGLSAPTWVAAQGHQFVMVEKTAATDPRFPRLPPKVRGWNVSRETSAEGPSVT